MSRKRNMRTRARGGTQRAPSRAMAVARPTMRFDSKELVGPVDPPKTSNDILVDKVVRITANVPQTGRLNITSVLIRDSLNVPAQGVHLRFSKISVWSQNYESNSVSGSDAETLTVIIPGSETAGAITGGDGGTFTDNGSFGSQRPGVHVRLPDLMASRWVVPGGSGEPDLLAQVEIDADEASGTTVIVHVSCQVRLTARKF